MSDEKSEKKRAKNETKIAKKQAKQAVKVEQAGADAASEAIADSFPTPDKSRQDVALAAACITPAERSAAAAERAVAVNKTRMIISLVMLLIALVTLIFTLNARNPANSDTAPANATQ